MIQFHDVHEIIRPNLKMGQCISFPIPVIRDGKQLDAFFVFTVDMATRQPDEPIGIYLVNMQEKSVSFDRSILGRIEFRPSGFRMPLDYSSLRNSARNLYGAARTEAFSGEIADASRQYASTVWSISQDSLKPYYKALSPDLFANCE